MMYKNLEVYHGKIVPRGSAAANDALPTGKGCDDDYINLVARPVAAALVQCFPDQRLNLPKVRLVEGASER
jgi:hypothetical protein